ncbi:hypothetical protein [Kitasatospora sp. NPDC058190]|uniref:hypothetical protein n=1 Tax=Kitasatospora sp. NPDC058190 TaxID=3346371 RepID=UPI0036DD7FDF
MRLSRRRTRTAVAVVLAALGLAAWARAVASAVAAPPVPERVDRPDVVPVALGVSRARPTSLSAVAVHARTGEPLAGTTVRFYSAAGRFLGSTVTGGDGVAEVGVPTGLEPGGHLAVVFGNGYHSAAQAALAAADDCLLADCPPAGGHPLTSDVAPVDRSRP